MKIILTNGVELSPISVTGGKRTVQGASRDTLSFVFSADVSLDEIDSMFASENCETITIVEGDNEYLYSAYTIRAELKREPVEVIKATETEAAVYENRVVVAMSQRTYYENQIAELTETVDLLVMESLKA